MATDPNLLMHLVNAPGLAGASVFAGQNQALEQAQGRQGLQINALKMNALRDAQRQEQEREAATTAYLADPSPGALSNLMTRFPEQAESYRKAWAVKDTAQKTADMGQLGSIYAALTNKRPDLAIAQLRQRRDAEKAKGMDTADIDHAIDGLQKGDPSAVNTLKGFVLAQLAAADPDKFAQTYGAVGEDQKGYTLGPGGRRYDADNKLVAEAPFAPRPITVGEGDTVVEYQPGGGDPASGGGSGQYTGGWTPRARNGGDNNDAAVDGKISGMSQALGISPTTPFPPGVSNMAIAKALTLSEGGQGSIADRNNNPGNLRDPKTGEFRKFPTKEAGLAAAASQVARNRARGQNTIASMVEGMPTGGSAGGGSPRVIAQGAPKPGYQLMTPAENEAAGLDPNVRYQRAPDGQITALGGQSKAQLKPVPPQIVTRVLDNRKAVRNIDGALAELKNYPDGIGFVVGNMPNTVSQRWDKKGVAVRAAIANIGSLLIHDRSGAAVTVSETPRLLPFIPLTSDTPDTAKKKLQRLKAEVASLNEDYETQYSEDQGYKPIAQSPTAPVRVRTVQEAAKLAPGTVYVTPNGKRYRR